MIHYHFNPMLSSDPPIAIYFLNFSDSTVAPERVKPSHNSLEVFSRSSL